MISGSTRTIGRYGRSPTNSARTGAFARRGTILVHLSQIQAESYLLTDVSQLLKFLVPPKVAAHMPGMM